MKRKAPVLVVFILFLLQACTQFPTRNWPALEGRVLDAQTEVPIEGAFIVTRWTGYGGYSQSQCFHVDVVQSDAQGRYRVEAWRNAGETAYLSEQRQTIETVYKPGYRLSPLTDERRTYLHGLYYLERDTGSGQERLEYLRGEIVGCSDRSVENANLLAFYIAIRDEVSNIPEAEGQAKIKIWLQNHIDKIEMGFDAAEKLYIERLKSLERTER